MGTNTFEKENRDEERRTKEDMEMKGVRWNNMEFKKKKKTQ